MSDVQVEYVDAESGETLGVRRLPAERVPDPLELRASLTLNEERFVVVAADPRLSGEVTARGALRLTVRRVVEVATADLEFRLPTLCETLPAFSRAEASERTLRIPRDGWRQVELVARTQGDLAARTILEVRRVLNDPSRTEGPGERRHADLVLRGRFYPSSIPGIDLAWLRGRFVEPVDFEGLTLQGLRVQIEGGFAFRLRSGVVLYGVESCGRARSLGVLGGGAGRFLFHDASALAEVLAVHALVLVDWCRGRLIAPKDLAAFLSD